jgi:hypothetical protein
MVRLHRLRGGIAQDLESNRQVLGCQFRRFRGMFSTDIGGVFRLPEEKKAKV